MRPAAICPALDGSRIVIAYANSVAESNLCKISSRSPGSSLTEYSLKISLIAKFEPRKLSYN